MADGLIPRTRVTTTDVGLHRLINSRLVKVLRHERMGTSNTVMARQGRVVELLHDLEY